MAEIWIAQYLCPARHALLALAYEPVQYPPAEVEQMIRAQMAAHSVRHVCGLCGSTVLRFEHRKLIWTDWTSATAALKRAEAENLLTRAYFDAIKQSPPN